MDSRVRSVPLASDAPVGRQLRVEPIWLVAEVAVSDDSVVDETFLSGLRCSGSATGAVR
jgi:hypothetical protein